MNFIICTPRNIPEKHKPLHHRKLTELLPILEVSGKTRKNSRGRTYVSYSFVKSTPSDEWDFLEIARDNYRRLIRQHHPDRGGSHDMAATLTAAWSRIKELFKRRGFELA